MNNKKKNILFIAPIFFDYYKEIINEMELLNYQVDFFCDSSNNSNLFKVLSRINKNFVKIPMHFYFKNSIIKNIRDKNYDCIFFIAGMTFSFSPKMLEILKKKNPKSRFILYQWDGEENIKFVRKMHYFFEEIYTFDRVDYLKNDKYKFLPLFYTKDYQIIGQNRKIDFKYDISYIGTAHPRKLFWIDKMANAFRDILPNQFIYHYIPSKFKYFYHKLTSKEYKKIKLKDLYINKMPKSELMEVFENSKCILDAPQDGQNGLTIRTIECLGAKRKLITTNEDIKNYDFYCEENILIYDGNRKNINNSFFIKPYKEIPVEVYEKYSLKNWLKIILKNVVQEDNK